MVRTAATLKKGESATVHSFDEDQMAAKLLEMGFIPGSKIQLIQKAPLGSTMYIKLHGSYVALREEEAKHVLLNF